MNGLSLDFTLGARMLVKYPGLTLVGGLAVALAVAVGAAFFEFATQAVNPGLPLSDGDRIVAIRMWDTAAARTERRTSHDFIAWRAQLETIQEIGAVRTVEQNLILGDAAEPEEVAEISASAFPLARVAPMLGRTLVDADEQPGAPSVVVIGYDIWQRRFGGDASVVGRRVHLGRVPTVVVGVMPPGFAFPVAHGLWTPLRLKAGGHERRRGPAIQVFGRLAPGVPMERAQSELSTVASRAARDFPHTHTYLRPQVIPYARSFFEFDFSGRVMYSINLFFVMFMILVCANVAALMFARAATRESEILVRTALGASRARIILQLFVEALVLGSVAAAVGLAAAGFELRWLFAVLEADQGRRMPFWFKADLSPATVLYAAALTALGAVIAGVLPALGVTRGLASRLRAATAGAGGLNFGGVWTAVLVSQVAVTVAFPSATFFVRRHVVQVQSLDVGFRAQEYLSVRLEADRPGSAADAAETPPAGFRATCDDLERRLVAEPGVRAVTFADHLPRTHHAQRWIEAEEAGRARSNAAVRQRVSRATVSPDFFDVLGLPILAGRGFRSGDHGVIVNQSFVDRVLEGATPIGRRVRYLTVDSDAASTPGPWHEIVGVVRDAGMIGDDVAEGAGIYHALTSGTEMPIYMAVHVNGDPKSFAARLRTMASAVDPTLRLRELLPLDAVGTSLFLEFNFLSKVLAIVSSIALLLSLAGIYSVMSLTVSRRTREIGIRVALGADARQIVAAIFSRAVTQVGMGVAAGGFLVFLLTQAVTGLAAKEIVVVTGYLLFMMGVCMLACIVPTRRALAVEPTEALRADG